MIPPSPIPDRGRTTQRQITLQMSSVSQCLPAIPPLLQILVRRV